MTLDSFLAAMATVKPGSLVKVEWIRDVKTLKGNLDTIQKHVQAVARIGIDYDKLKSTIEKRKSGELPKENAGLPWGEWFAFPYLIQHNGRLYSRFTKGISTTTKPKAEFLLNGKIIEKSEIAGKLLASELKSVEGDVFSCKLEDVTRIAEIVDSAE